MVLGRPLTDLRAQPHTTAQPTVHDPLQETQLLYGERVEVRKIEGGWAFIEAVWKDELIGNRGLSRYRWADSTLLFRLFICSLSFIGILTISAIFIIIINLNFPLRAISHRLQKDHFQFQLLIKQTK